MQIQVYQGERDIAAYNKKLGMFELAGLPPAPRGVPQIEVTFDIDANGIVHVSAKDLGTGREQRIQISGGSAVSKEDIDRMVAEAEQYADEDRRRREEAEVRNSADALVFQTEKFLADNSDKIDDEGRTEVTDAVAELRRALEGDDLEAVRSAQEKVALASQKVGTAMYAAAAAAQGADTGAADAPTGEAAGDDDVVDAEVVDDDASSGSSR